MSDRWSAHEAGVRWLEHALGRDGGRVDRLAQEIGSVNQAVRMLRPRAYRPAPPSSPGCGTVSGVVLGCAGIPYAGATVQLSLGGVEVHTVTSGIDGTYVLDYFTTGSYVIQAFAPSVSATQSVALAPSTYTCPTNYTGVTLQMAPSSANYCLDWDTDGVGVRRCVETRARSTAFNLTDSIVGTTSLTDAATLHQGGKAYSYPGCAGCAATSVNVVYALFHSAANGVALRIRWNQTAGCPAFFGADLGEIFATCPDADFSCSPFSATFQVTHPKLYCGATATITVTD